MPVSACLVCSCALQHIERLKLTSYVDAIATTVPHELHQLRRKAVENFFSKQSVTRLESRIHHEARSLDEKLLDYAGTGAIVRLDHAFSCVTGDLAGQFACGENPELLEESDFNPEWSAAPKIA